MQVIIVKDAQGREVSRIKASGEKIQLNVGEWIECLGDADELTSLVREGTELRFFLNNVILVKVTNFFSVDNGGLHFHNEHFSVADIAAQLNLHILITSLNGTNRDLMTCHGSRILVSDGDTFEFLNTEVHPSDLHRSGADLRVSYHLEDGSVVQVFLIGFFTLRADQIKPPVVVLADKEHHTTDLFVQPQQQNFRMNALPITVATAGTLYAFYFVIQNYDPEKSEVEVLLDGKNLPDWLSLNYMGAGKFILSGIPPIDFEGTKNVEINVTNKEEGVYVRTQESYQLVVSARAELSERAAVVGVLTAETRGGMSTHSSEGFMSGSQSAAAASAAPLAIVAALSSLTVFQTVKGVQLEGGEFSASDLTQFLKDDLDLDTTGLKIGQASLDSGSTAGYGISESSMEQISDQRRYSDRRERDTRDDRDDDTAVLQDEPGQTLQEFISAYDTSTATLAAPFTTSPDIIDVNEDSILIFGNPTASYKVPNGILQNDINLQTPVFFVEKFEFFNTSTQQIEEYTVNQLVTLPSGATVRVFSPGAIIYNPNGAWEFLAQGQVVQDPTIITYTVNNIISQANNHITFNITGQNDLPIITNQLSFTVNENTPDGTLVGNIVASDVDILDRPQLTLTEESGETNYFTVSNNGVFVDPNNQFALAVQNVNLLDYETLRLSGFNGEEIDFVVRVNDPFGGQATANIRVEVINVNEAPSLDDYDFNLTNTVIQIRESTLTPTNNPVGTDLLTVSAVDDDLRIVGNDVMRYFEHSPLAELRINMFSGLIEIDQFSMGTEATSLLNFEQYAGGSATFDYVVRVDDDFILGGPVLSDLATIRFEILNVNERPDIQAQTFTISEDTINGTMVNGGNLVATDPDLVVASQGEFLTFTDQSLSPVFTINNNVVWLNFATITVANSGLLDFETTPYYDLTVRVSDAGLFLQAPGQSAVLNDTATIRINVENANDAPIAANIQTPSVSENVVNGTIVGNLANLSGLVGGSTNFGIDQDLSSAVGSTLTFALAASNTQTAFSISANGNIVVLDQSQINYENAASISLDITVTDNGLAIFGTPNLSSTTTLTINLFNEIPVIEAQTAAFSMNENVAVGTVVGTVNLASYDTDGVLPTFLGSNTDFIINGTTGVITTARLFDYETDADSYNFSVTADDGDDISAAEIFVINLNNLNDSPPSVDLNSNTVNASRNHSVSFDISTNTAVYITQVSGATRSADIDDAEGSVTQLQVTLTDIEEPGFENLLFLTPSGSISHTYVVTSSTATLTYSGLSNISDYITLLKGVQYRHNGSGANEASLTSNRIITVEVSDGVNPNPPLDTATTTVTFQPLVAEAGEMLNGPEVANLTLADAYNLLTAARYFWDAAGHTGDWANITLGLADLPGAVLGYTYQNFIILDINGAGHGWFIDQTPYDSAEFELAVNGVYQNASEQIDLLTVIMHEVGHVLNLDHAHESGSVMSEDLANGTRILPDDHLLAMHDLEMDFSNFEDHDNQTNTLEQVASHDLLSDHDEIDINESQIVNRYDGNTEHTQTSYTQDLLPAAQDSIQDIYSGANAGANDPYASLVIQDHAQQVV